VTVPSGSGRPYSYQGQAYRRVGATSLRLSRDEYNEMLLERVHADRRWENEEATGWAVADLDHDQIAETVAEAVRRGRLDEPGTREPELLLRGLHLLRGARSCVRPSCCSDGARKWRLPIRNACSGSRGSGGPPGRNSSTAGSFTGTPSICYGSAVSGGEPADRGPGAAGSVRARG